VLFSAWLMLVLFGGTPEGQKSFPDYWESVDSLIVLLTTANNPSVWSAIYDQHRVACLVFIGYLSLGIFLLMNILLATVYEAYKSSVAAAMEEEMLNRGASLKRAFVLLDRQHSGSIGRSQVYKLFEALNRYIAIPHIHLRDFNEIFAELDQDNSFTICLSEFEELASLLESFPSRRQYNFVSAWLARVLPSRRMPVGTLRRLQLAVFSTRFEWGINGLLVLNFFTIIVETHLGLIPGYQSEQSTLQSLEQALTVVYFIEMMLKVWAYGWDDYWYPLQNKFDFTITWMVTIIQMIIVVPNGIDSRSVIRYAQLCRILRIVRLLEYVPQYRVIINTAAVVIPSLSQLIFAMFCLLYLFAILGVQLFGGMVKDRGNNPKLHGTGYESSGYESFNFNDFGSGMVVLFNILILNDWYSFMDCYVALTGTRLTRIYFFLFWIVAVVYMLNLVVAFILEAFIAQMALIEEQQSKRNNLAQEANSSTHNEAPQTPESAPSEQAGSSAPRRRTLANNQRFDVLRKTVFASKFVGRLESPALAASSATAPASSSTYSQSGPSEC